MSGIVPRELYRLRASYVAQRHFPYTGSKRSIERWINHPSGSPESRLTSPRAAGPGQHLVLSTIYVHIQVCLRIS